MPLVTELLYANSAIGSRETQLFCLWLVYKQRYASIVWLRHSVWPSICGWESIDIRSRIPNRWRNSFHTSKVKREVLIRDDICRQPVVFPDFAHKDIRQVSHCFAILGEQDVISHLGESVDDSPQLVTPFR